MTKALDLFGEKEGTLPAHLKEAQAAGNENVGREDVAMPRLVLVQALSAAVEEGAKPGSYYNTISAETYEDVYVINLHYSKEYAVFKDRKLGNEFQGTYDTKSEAEEHIQTLDHPNDYGVTETGRHALLLLDQNGAPIQPMIFNMSNTALQVSRMWNSQIVTKLKDLPRYAGVWILSNKKMSNTRGSWFVPDIKWAGLIQDEKLFRQVEQFYDQVKAA